MLNFLDIPFGATLDHIHIHAYQSIHNMSNLQIGLPVVRYIVLGSYQLFTVSRQ